MADETTHSGPHSVPSLPALLGRLQIILVIIAALILSAVVLAHALVFLWHVPNVGLVALVNLAAPEIGVLLMTIATYIGWYGTWRIARRKDTYDVHADLKTHAADIPYALSRLGCISLVSPILLGATLVVTGATYAPPPLNFLGNDNPAPVTATATPIPTPVPTATPVPTLSFALSPTDSTWDCNTSGRAIAPVNLVLDNSASNVHASWTATAREKVGLSAAVPWASVSPAQGTIPAGQTETIQLTVSSSDCAYASPAGTPYHLDIVAMSSASATPSTATFTYTITGLRRVSFRLNPTQYPSSGSETCDFFTTVLPTANVTLDNSGSNVDIAWKATITDKDGPGNVWATVSPGQGTVPAGKTATMKVTPASDACGQPIPQSGFASYHVIVTLTSGVSGSYTFTYNVNWGPQ